MLHSWLILYISILSFIRCDDDSNCTFVHLKLRDCPRNIDCFHLNLNDNLISSLNTSNCQTSVSNTYKLSINDNQLTGFRASLPRLNVLSAVNNSIETVDISQLFNLRKLNLAMNKVRRIKINRSNFMEQLNLSNNALKEENLDGIFTEKHLPNLEQIDLSFNKIDKLKLVTFYLSNLNSIDLSNNQLTHIELDYFPYSPLYKQSYDLILANNQISDITSAGVRSNIALLNLSKNKIKKFQPEFMKFVDASKNIHLDISGNPLTCDCQSNYDFIVWLHKNSIKFLQKSASFCSNKSMGNIFKFVCNSSSSTSSSSTTTTTTTTTATSTTTTGHTSTRRIITKIITKPSTIIQSTTYHKKLIKTSGNYYLVILIIPLLIILFVGFVIFRNHQRGLPLLTFSVATFRNNNYIQSSHNSEDRLRFLDDSFEAPDLPYNVTILCAPDQSEWVSLHIISHIEMECHILSDQLHSSSPSNQLTSSSRYIVVFVGLSCITDNTLSNNIQVLLASRFITKPDIGLILGFMPSLNDESIRKLEFGEANSLKLYQQRFSYKTFILTNENSMNHSMMIDKLNEWIGIPL